MCSNSGCKKMFEQVNYMKEHINTEHKQKSPANYSFHYWNIHAKNNFNFGPLSLEFWTQPRPWGRETGLSSL